MGTGTCAVDGCTALEFRTTGRCLNHQDVPAKPQAASSGPSAINFSNPGHAPEVPGAINFSEADQPSAAPEDYMVEVGGTQMEVRDAVRSIPGPPSPTPSLISVGVIVGSLALLVSALLIDVHHGWYQLFCGAMVVGSLVLIVFEARSSNIKKSAGKRFSRWPSSSMGTMNAVRRTRIAPSRCSLLPVCFSSRHGASVSFSSSGPVWKATYTKRR